MKVGRLFDLLIGMPVRFIILLVLWPFWALFTTLVSIFSGDWSDFKKHFVASVRWIWKPSLEPDFWPKDGAGDVM